MKKMIFWVFTVLMIVQGKAQAVTVYQTYGSYSGTYYTSSYSFDASGYFHYSFTVYPGGFTNGANNVIGVTISSDTYDVPFYYSRETSYSNSTSPVVFSGSVYLTTTTADFLLNMDFNSDDYSNSDGFRDEGHVDFSSSISKSFAKTNISRPRISINLFDNSFGNNDNGKVKNTYKQLVAFSANKIDSELFDDRIEIYNSYTI